MFRHISFYSDEKICNKWFFISERCLYQKRTLFNWFLFFSSNDGTFSNFMEWNEWRKLCNWFIFVILYIKIFLILFYPTMLSKNVFTIIFGKCAKDNAIREQRVDNISEKFLKFIITITHNWAKEFLSCANLIL